MVRTTLFLAALVFLGFATGHFHAAEPPKTEQSLLEKKLLGEWSGPACGGDWIFNADRTFEAFHYSPGNYHLTGTWELRWDALPPTLMRTIKTSDDPDQAGVGKPWEVRLTQLSNESLAYQDSEQHPKGHTVRYERTGRTPGRELAALQGTWTPLHYEEHGETVTGDRTRHIVRGDVITVEVNGKTHAVGKLVLNPQHPEYLDLEFPGDQTHRIRYVRSGPYVICCGNHNSKTRPVEFITGTAKGGEYLITWRIEK